MVRDDIAHDVPRTVLLRFGDEPQITMHGDGTGYDVQLAAGSAARVQRVIGDVRAADDHAGAEGEIFLAGESRAEAIEDACRFEDGAIARAFVEDAAGMGRLAGHLEEPTARAAPGDRGVVPAAALERECDIAALAGLDEIAARDAERAARGFLLTAERDDDA